MALLLRAAGKSGSGIDSYSQTVFLAIFGGGKKWVLAPQEEGTFNRFFERFGLLVL